MPIFKTLGIFLLSYLAGLLPQLLAMALSSTDETIRAHEALSETGFIHAALMLALSKNGALDFAPFAAFLMALASAFAFRAVLGRLAGSHAATSLPLKLLTACWVLAYAWDALVTSRNALVHTLVATPYFQLLASPLALELKARSVGYGCLFGAIAGYALARLLTPSSHGLESFRPSEA